MVADGSSFDAAFFREEQALCSEKFGYFPKTRYCGSKRRLIGWLHQKFNCHQFNTALDVFGGTGTVSLLLLQMGKEVSFHDGFVFNEISARALMGPQAGGMQREDFISTIDSISAFDGFISKTFKGLYYKHQENRWLDGLQKALDSKPREHLDVILYCAFQACLQKRPYNMFHRANLSLRTRKNVARSFGNFRTWDRPFEELMTRAYDELQKLNQVLPRAAKIIAPTPLMDLPVDFDFVYIDPPYLRKKKNESYLHRYHFLEGMARHEEWPGLIDPYSKIKAFKEPYLLGGWEDNERIFENLSQLVSKFRKSTVAMSYMTDGVPEIKSIKKIFQSFFPKVTTHKKPYGYALSSRSVDEVLIIGEPE